MADALARRATLPAIWCLGRKNKALFRLGVIFQPAKQQPVRFIKEPLAGDLHKRGCTAGARSRLAVR